MMRSTARSMPFIANGSGNAPSRGDKNARASARSARPRLTSSDATSSVTRSSLASMRTCEGSG